jgi:hypothetical protein
LKKRALLVALATLFVVSIGSQAALAVSPHFIRADGTLSGTSLTVSFKEAGLGTNQNIDYVLSADVSATYVCVNNGGANPSAANKTTINTRLEVPGTFSSGKNGQVTASLTLNAPSAGDFTCPPGQTLRLAEVTYTNVTLTDTTNDVTIEVEGTFTTGCLLPNVRGAC